MPLVIGTDLGVLANDISPDGTAMTVEVVTGPENGTLTLNADGSYTYDPNGKFSTLPTGQFANDTFTYAITDNHSAVSNTATVTIRVQGVLAEGEGEAAFGAFGSAGDFAAAADEIFSQGVW